MLCFLPVHFQMRDVECGRDCLEGERYGIVWRQH